ncbi:MAG: Hpt domain-containing protein [Methylococcaceae bacterium]|jgi:chemotaxis protein histidine kinase CheA
MNAREDAVLLEMFDAEVETHMGVLCEGLIALEQDPNQSQWYEPLMRAAHSIKGASDLFDLKAAVKVSHVIEDTFTSAREGRLAVTSHLVDVLLAGVDLLGRVTRIDGDADASVDADDISLILNRIQQAALGMPLAAAATAEKSLLQHPAALDERWVSQVHTDLGQWLEAGSADLAIRLDQVTDVAPSALALLAMASRVSRQDRRLLLQDASPQVAELLRAMGMDKLNHPIRRA